MLDSGLVDSSRLHSAPVLVTGGAGYIGSNVALALLDAGRPVIVLDDLSTGSPMLLPEGAIFVEGRAGDRPLVERLIRAHGIEAVVHLAASISVAESVAEPARYYMNNLAETVALADAAARGGVKALIFSSTAAVYGEGGSGTCREADPVAAINPYGRSKAMAEAALDDIGAASGMGIGVLRYFNAAGADPMLRSGQASRHPHHLIEIATRVLTGERARLTIFGTDYPTRDGTAVRDYVHVRDIAHAHVLLMQRLLERPGRLTFNVGSGEGATVREVVDALGAIAGRRLPVAEGARRPGDPAVLIADSSRIRAELGWAPKLSALKDILRHALQWERQRAALAARTVPAVRRVARPTVRRAAGSRPGAAS
jgi:UDP-glucose 4-epimerase